MMQLSQGEGASMIPNILGNELSSKSVSFGKLSLEDVKTYFSKHLQFLKKEINADFQSSFTSL